MGKVWVLETQTKGTGATMVPLERVLRKGSDAVPGFVLPERRRQPEVEEPRGPLSFKLVNVMTRQVLGEGLDARSAIELLEGVERIVDVTVYVLDRSRDRWRMLTFGETKALWDHRGRLSEPQA